MFNPIMSRLKVKVRATFISVRKKKENIISQNETDINVRVDLIPLGIILF